VAGWGYTVRNRDKIHRLHGYRESRKGQEEAGKGYMHNIIRNDGSTVKQKV
jgi:hypothetical protein